MIYNTRLIDVFILGPLQIHIGLHIFPEQYENKTLWTFLRYFMIITGISNIIYNGHNYLFVETKQIKTNYFPFFTDAEDGKTQIHRLYNLLIMYPIFLYVFYNIKMHNFFRSILLLDTIFGFGFNLYNFLKLANKEIKI